MDSPTLLHLRSSPSMAKVFYLGGGSYARGMLRAVVTLEQLNSFVSPDAVSYMGTDFPDHEFAGPVTLVQISSDETAERLKFLPESEEPPEKTPQQKQRNGSGLIRWLTRDTRACD